MKACGIVAEYNPLHTGHIYQMNKARQISQADCIIVVMSGNFVQRGEPAVIDKYARTSAALKAGADIVVELPVYYALSSAENFAKGAVLTLNTMKSASICFGAETDNADCLAKISRTIISESPEYKAILNKALAEGLSYPAARQTALLEYLPECKDIITGSNNILAIEYIKAILYNNLNMTYYPVLREGAGYNDDTDTAEYASAFGIRKMLMSDEHDRLKTYLTAGMYEEIAVLYFLMISVIYLIIKCYLLSRYVTLIILTLLTDLLNMKISVRTSQTDLQVHLQEMTLSQNLQ